MTTVQRTEHEESAACWCNPIVFVPCPECEPFNGVRDSDVGRRRVIAERKRDHAIIEALALKYPVHGVTPRRPFRSKGCWKCLGVGIIYLEKGEESDHGIVIHRKTADKE